MLRTLAATTTTTTRSAPGEERAAARLPRRVGDRFELLEELGRGAMGVVHRGLDREGGQAVAVKLYLRVGPRSLARAAQEASAVGRLDHPNVVRLLASGQEAGRPWLAYELVPGARTLTVAFLDASPARRLGWVLDAARGLGHAHARGVVHRDVKPDNVLVDAAGVARVIDFGLARVGGGAGISQRRRIGTPLVMSPEQVRGLPPTPATDVWGLGGVLFAALVGRLPFEHIDDADVLCRAILLGRPPSPRRLDPTTPRALEALTLDALARDPARRPADGAAFARRLERCLAGGPGAWLEAARALLCAPDRS